jgi:hypothetical protein
MDPLHISNPPTVYLEGLQAGYHKLDAARWDPLLVKTILENGDSTYAPVTHEGTDMPAGKIKGEASSRYHY